MRAYADLTVQDQIKNNKRRVFIVTQLSSIMLLKRSTCFLLRNSNYLRESFLPAHRNPIQTTNRFISISSKVSEPKDWCRKCFKCLTIGVEGGFRQNGGIFFGKLMNFFVDFFFFVYWELKLVLTFPSNFCTDDATLPAATVNWMKKTLF